MDTLRPAHQRAKRGNPEYAQHVPKGVRFIWVEHYTDGKAEHGKPKVVGATVQDSLLLYN